MRHRFLTSTARHGSLGFLLASALTLTAAVATARQDPAPPDVDVGARRDDPRAVALLAEVARAYQTLPSYRDEGEFVVSMTIADQPRKQVSPLRLSLVRPNRLRLDAGAVRIISNGETLTTVIEPLKKYLTAPAPKNLTLDDFREGPIGATLFGGPSGVPMYIVLNLLVSPEPEALIGRLGGALRLVEELADDATQAILIDQQDGDAIKLTIDARTKLLKAVELVVDPKAPPENAEETTTNTQLGWSAVVVDLEPIDDDVFSFKIPDGFSRIEPFQAEADAKVADDERRPPNP